MQIQRVLSGATTAARRGRNLLKDARNRIGETLKVASNARRKQNLITASETINRLNSLMKLRTTIEQILDAVPMKTTSQSEKEYSQRDAELLQAVKFIKTGQVRETDLWNINITTVKKIKKKLHHRRVL